MADLTHYRLAAIGPASAIAGIENASIRISNGVRTVAVRGQSLTPQLVLSRQVVPQVEYSDKAGMYAPGFAAVSAFGLHFVAQADTGGDGAGVLSFVADAFRVPQSVSANKDGEATSRCQIMFKSGFTVGTASKSLGTATALYKIGASTVAGSAVAGIESQEITFGSAIWTNAGQTGSLYATEMLLLSSAPVITITTTNLALVSTYIGGAAVTSSACVLKFASIAAPTTGYGYTLAKAFIVGSIQGGDPPTGTLTITPYGGELVAGATY
jgi:hypothetical protein